MPGAKSIFGSLCACHRGDSRGGSKQQQQRDMEEPEQLSEKRISLSQQLSPLPQLSEATTTDEASDDMLTELPASSTITAAAAAVISDRQQQHQQQLMASSTAAAAAAAAAIAAQLSAGTSRRGSLYSFRHSDEVIVTPFAQVLHTLRSVYDSVKTLTAADNAPNHKADSTAKSTGATAANEPDDEDYTVLAEKTLKDLEWCLEQLETVQTHRSVADMASSKFKKLLNIELERMSSGPSASNASTANQIENYIKSTFLEKDDDEEGRAAADAAAAIVSGSQPQQLQQQSPRSPKEANGAQATMTRVPVQALRSPSLSEVPIPPQLGVETPHADELSALFSESLDKWGIDIFRVDQLSSRHPLVTVVFSIFEKRDFLGKFRIHPSTLVNYFTGIEAHYRQDNPYHNAIHAADVTQSTHVLLNAASLVNVFSDLEILASIFACAIHDVNHPGVTNQFLINTENELAIMYNDMSVLENHHCAVAFKLLQQPNCNILRHLDDAQRKQLRKMVIDMVLATDMSKHMSLLADLKTMVETKKVAGGCLLKLDNYSEKMQIMQNMVHCADLSNPAKPLPLSTQWVTRVMEEFFNQGDREKALGLPVSPMCCRETANIEKSQVSFIDFIVHPLWEAWTELVHPDAEHILSTLEQNRDHYCELSAAREAEESQQQQQQQQQKQQQKQHRHA